MKSIVTWLAIWIAVAVMSAQELHRLTGLVTDTQGSPLPGAIIEIVEQPASASVKADDAGKFELRDLPSGTYTVQAKLPGFRADTKTVRLGRGRTASAVRFVMQIGVLSEALFVVPAPLKALRKAKAIALVRLDGVAPPGPCSLVVSNVHNATVIDLWKGRVPAKVQIDEPNKGTCIEDGRIALGIGGDASKYERGSQYVVLLSGSGKGNRYGGLGAGSYVFPVRDGMVTTDGFADFAETMPLAEFRNRLKQLAR